MPAIDRSLSDRRLGKMRAGAGEVRCVLRERLEQGEQIRVGDGVPGVTDAQEQRPQMRRAQVIHGE